MSASYEREEAVYQAQLLAAESKFGPGLRRGTKVQVHGQHGVVVEYWPCGSSAAEWPHYVVRFPCGDPRVVVALHNVRPL